MKSAIIALLLANTAAMQRRHHHHRQHKQINPFEYVHATEDTHDMESLEGMSTEKLVSGMRNTLNLALEAEARDDKAAAVAKTAAIKNIQKALTARILKRLDDGQPLVEVARKMKAIEGMQPQINDMERRLGIMQSVEPVLENAIKTLQKVVDVRGMGKKALLQVDEETFVYIGKDKDDEGPKDGKEPVPPCDEHCKWMKVMDGEQDAIDAHKQNEKNEITMEGTATIKGSEKKIQEVNIDAIANMGMAYGSEPKEEKKKEAEE